MNKIFKLSFANIRKTKSHTVSLILIFLISALLLNLGLLIFLNFGNFFKNTTDELNASDLYYTMPKMLYSEEVESYLRNNDNVLETQKMESLWMDGKTTWDGRDRSLTFLLNDAGKERSLSKWKFVGEHLPAGEMSIYLPYIFEQSGGYRLNDPFQIKVKDKTLTFTIKGFTEDVYFSSTDTGIMGAYLPRETYEKVLSEFNDPQYQAVVIFANLKEINKEVETGIREIITANPLSTYVDIESDFFSFDLSLINMSRTMMASIVSIMTVAFSAIIAVVCLIVVRFRIGNSIEEDMTKIGSLKAIGYTSRQISLSIVVQYALIAFAGSILGILLSYFTVPAISDIFAVQSGLKWEQGFDAMISTIALLSILLIVVLVSFFSAHRIHKLNPIVALRGGIITHSFKKNHMPLDKSRGSLPIALAFKSMLQNLKQSIMIIIIMIAVAFSGTFAVVMFYNTVIDTKTFAETPGMEISNSIALLNSALDNTEIIQSIREKDHVRKVQFVDDASLKVDKTDLRIIVMEDYASKETNTVYEGRYPLHDNEIVLAGTFATMIQKSIGDNVTVGFGDKQTEFIVTGLSQGSQMGGMNASVTLDAILKLNPDFKQQSLQIYLDKGTDAAAFTEKLQSDYGDKILSAINMDKGMEEGMGIYTSVVSKVGIAMLVVTALVVVLVLYFVINSSIIRKRRELGVQKAIGFTTFQLMNQLSVGFMIPIVIGIILGCILGILETNSIMSVAQRSMGIMKANYIITPLWIALFGAITLIVSYATSMLITWRIRKISAYALVTE